MTFNQSESRSNAGPALISIRGLKVWGSLVTSSKSRRDLLASLLGWAAPRYVITK